MADDFKTGSQAKVTFTPAGGAPITLANANWKLKLTSKLAEFFNTRDGIRRRRTIEDATGSVEGYFDALQPPQAEMDSEDEGVLKLYVDDTRFYQLTAVTSDVNVDSKGILDPISVTFDFSLAGGTIVKPLVETPPGP
jgi:hypothetical protein